VTVSVPVPVAVIMPVMVAAHGGSILRTRHEAFRRHPSL
jgi:hypothetical protein